MPINDSWHKSDTRPTDHRCTTHNKVPTKTHGKGKRWEVREGSIREFYDKLSEARARLKKIRGESDATPTLASDITLNEFASQWYAHYRVNFSSRERLEIDLRLHIIPLLGDYTLRELEAKPAILELWLTTIEQCSAPETARNRYILLKQIFQSARSHKLIAHNPLDNIKAPKVPHKLIIPKTEEQVRNLIAALPERYRLMANLGAEAGMRQGEIFGICGEDITPTHVNVVRLVKPSRTHGGNVFALPKGDKTRQVPINESLYAKFQQHQKMFDATPITLPWGNPNGKPTTHDLLFVSPTGLSWRSANFNDRIWKPALREVNIKPDRDSGMHALRHFFACVALFYGVDIKTLSVFLGHSSPIVTLKYYAHLMPGGSDAMRAAIGHVFK
jgi:integrase